MSPSRETVIIFKKLDFRRVVGRTNTSWGTEPAVFVPEVAKQLDVSLLPRYAGLTILWVLARWRDDIVMLESNLEEKCSG